MWLVIIGDVSKVAFHFRLIYNFDTCLSIRPRGYKTFSSSAQMSMKFQLLINTAIVKLVANSSSKLKKPNKLHTD